MLKDNLNEGFLFDLKTLQGLDERIEWFDKYYKFKEHYRDRKFDNIVIQSKLKKITPGDTVYLWLGDEGNEYIWMCAILNFLLKTKLSIYVIDWSKISFNNFHYKELSAYSLQVSAPQDVILASKNFRRLTNPEQNIFSELWINFLKNNSPLRILKELSSILETDIEYL